MDQRKRIGLSFSHNNTSNAGVVNYLFSFIKALNTLDNSQKPHLVIFYAKESPIDMIKAENYPYISFKLNDGTSIYDNIFFRVINKVSRTIIKKNIFFKRPFSSKDADYIFPLGYNLEGIENKVHWLVDFSPYYIPDHLTPEQREDYFKYVKSIAYSTDKVVLSSYDIFNDLKKFYPDYTCKVEILRFASVLPPFGHVDATAVKKKFGINDPFIMTPNQFWVHKNHMVMLKAAKILKDRNIPFQIVFTGSVKVEVGSKYYPELLQFIEENGLQNEIKILGIVDRAEQLTLMKSAAALVQPSLFEGWSTLVEESKALNKHIVVSDLPIHREQIDFNCTFFDPHNEHQLADILQAGFENGFEVKPYDYTKDIHQYAIRITEIFN